MQKHYVMAINQHLWNIALNLQSIQEEILTIIFRAIRSTKHLVDWVPTESTKVQEGTVWVSNFLMVWSILTMVMVVCRLTILFFSPQGTYVPCI